MIRIFLCGSGSDDNEEDDLASLSLIELQGKLSVPSDILPDSEEELRKKLILWKNSRTEREAGYVSHLKEEVMRHGEGKKEESLTRSCVQQQSEERSEKKESASNPRGSRANTLFPLPPAVSIGFIHADPTFPSKRILRMGTTKVMGTVNNNRDPILVLRRRRRESSRDGGVSTSVDQDYPPQGADAGEETSSLSSSCSSSSSSFPTVAVRHHKGDGDSTWEEEDRIEHEDPSSSDGVQNVLPVKKNEKDGEGEAGGEHCNNEREEEIDEVYEKLIASSHAWRRKEASEEEEDKVPGRMNRSKGEGERVENRLVRKVRDVVGSGTRKAGDPQEEKERNGEPRPPPVMMFSDWIKQHPEMLRLESHFGDAAIHHHHHHHKKKKKIILREKETEGKSSERISRLHNKRAISERSLSEKGEWRKEDEEDEKEKVKINPDFSLLPSSSPSSFSLCLDSDILYRRGQASDDARGEDNHRRKRRREEVGKSISTNRVLASMEIKDFEVVGVVTDGVIFNSKPTRVFR